MDCHTKSLRLSQQTRQKETMEKEQVDEILSFMTALLPIAGEDACFTSKLGFFDLGSNTVSKWRAAMIFSAPNDAQCGMGLSFNT